MNQKATRLLILLAPVLFGATWNTDVNNSNWNVNGNWTSPATFPHAVGATATFGSIITANRSVNLAQDITIGTITFNDNNNYLIQSGAGTNTLSFDVAAGTASLSVLVGNTGTHTISAQMSLSDSLTLANSTAPNFTLSGAISGAGGIIVNSTGTGAFILSAANSYGGTTNLQAGSVTYNINGAIPAASAVTIGNGAAPNTTLTINAAMTAPNGLGVTTNSDGTLLQSSGATTFLTSLQGNGTVTLSGGSAATDLFQIDTSSSTVFSGTLSGGSSSFSSDPTAGNRLVKEGTGTLTITGSSSGFDSRTFIANGVIDVQNGSGLGTSAPNKVVYVRSTGTSGSLYVENAISLSKILFLNGSGFSGTGALRNVSGVNTVTGGIQIGWSGGPETASDVTIQVDGTSLTLSGVISGSNMLTKTGAGTLIYSGGSSNTLSGETVINQGTLQLNKSGGLTSIAGDVTINAGGTLFLSLSNQIANTSTISLSGGTFNMNGRNDTIQSLVFSSGTLTQGGGLLSLAATSGAALTMGDGTAVTGNLSLTGASGSAGVTYNGAVTTATISGNINLNTRVRDFIIADGAALIDLQVSGIISNGGITKQGAGLLLLTGANSYSGGTTVSAGILQGDTTGLQGAIVNNAAVVFDQVSTGTYSGVMSGTGSLTKQNTGTVILLGANSYSGGTAVSAGTLQGNTTSLQGAIANNAAVIFDQSFTGTYAGAMSGTGSLTKQNTGTLILSSASSTPGGSVAVLGGTLVVDGSLIGGGAMTVSAGSRLQGIGTIAKDATISGTLAPGDSIGTIHLQGSQVLSAGSTLEIELNRAAVDLVDIVGTLTIQSGSSLRILPEAGVYPTTTFYTIVQTTGGVTGTFSSTTTSLAFPLLSTTVVYSPLDVQILLRFLPFSDLIKKGNAGAVARCLDAITENPCSDLSQVIDSLRMLSTIQKVKSALIQLQPSPFTSIAVSEQNDTLYMRNVIYNRLEESQRTWRSPRKSVVPRKFVLWSAALGAHTSQRNSQKEPGFIANSPGAVIGFDGRLAKRSCVGGAVGYARTHLHWREERGFANFRSAYGMFYGQWRSPRFYAQGQVIGSSQFYAVHREIDFGFSPEIKATAHSRHTGSAVSSHAKAGLLCRTRPVRISPFVGLDYLFLHERSFRETGARSLNLHIKSKNSTLVVIEGGLDFSRSFSFKTSFYAPFFKVSCVREERISGKHERASLACGCQMTTTGLYPSRTLACLTLGVNAGTPLHTVSFFYQGKFTHAYSDQSCYLQYLFKF